MNTKLAQIQEFINSLDNQFSEQQQFTMSVCAEPVFGGTSYNNRCVNSSCSESVNDRRCTNQKGQCKDSINWGRCKEKEIKK